MKPIKSKATNETISHHQVEAKIAENVGRDQHSLNFTSLKNTPRKYIKNLKDKFKGADELADVGELFDIDLNAFLIINQIQIKILFICNN